MTKPAANIYEARVAEALSEWGSSSRALSLPYFELLTSALEHYNASPAALPDAGEGLTRSVWLEVFKTYFTFDCDPHCERDLLNALFDNNRWRALFDEDHTAHMFVFLVARFIADRTVAGSHAKIAMLGKFLGAMSDWIEPTATVDTETKIRAIAAGLFGNAWCALVYDVRSELETLAVLVINLRPAFLPGRLATSQEQHAYALPELGEDLQAS